MGGEENKKCAIGSGKRSNSKPHIQRMEAPRHEDKESNQEMTGEIGGCVLGREKM